MAINEVFAGIVVSDRDNAAAWYARLLGRAADYLPNDIEAVWRVTDTVLVYVVADEANAGHSSLSLIVDDLDSFLAGAREQGIQTGEVADGEYKTSIVFDPEGNKITLVQLPDEWTAPTGSGAR